MKQVKVSVQVSEAKAVDPAVRELCAAQQAELESRYGADSGEPLKGIDPAVSFLVARIAGEPVGCAGLKPLEPGIAEVTRMYVRPAHRGHGISRLLLREVEGMAKACGVTTIRLETGDLQPESISLYGSSGYQRIPAFGPYVGSPLSLCFEKPL
ncbi:MAG TPA: GNAT family N-acetyltransferase [Streptosporangiaceae bacterium]|nr:GNAT family N-acetyltransferase [Streptosporangiaceae bacterium]